MVVVFMVAVLGFLVLIYFLAVAMFGGGLLVSVTVFFRVIENPRNIL